MIRRPPRSTRTDTLFPTRRSSDLLNTRCTNGWPDEDCVRIPPAFVEPMAIAACPPRELPIVSTPAQSAGGVLRSEEHTSELQSLMRISYAVFCLKKKKTKEINIDTARLHRE